MGSLFALFVVVPAVELALLIEIGSRIGTLATLGLIVVTGMAGASLARWQGFGVLRRIQEDMAEGRLPADAMLDGAIVLAAGALLLTPGVLTDAFGLACLVPPLRRRMKAAVIRRLERAGREGRVHVFVAGGPGGGFPGFGDAPPGFGHPSDHARDVTPRETDAGADPIALPDRSAGLSRDRRRR